ncbi:tetratricopeptide repeat protein [Achromobacter piechaudii]|uniref:tetratricopeptide repeat protein n=1 Tax=Achromobacter piechaudii TaxID=72556 RepID=UPI003DA872AD
MTLFPLHRLTPLILAAACLFAPAVVHAEPAPDHAAAPTAPPPGMPQYGSGPYGRFLTLTLLNNRDAAPAPNTPYRLFLTGKGDSIQGTPSQDGILHGVTDELGRTAWVWTEQPHPPEDFTLIRRIGDGAWGHFFQLNSSNDKTPVPAWPYIMTMPQRWGEQWVDLGYTTQQGATAYFSHDVPAASLSLSIDADVVYDRSCFDELDAITRRFAQDDVDGANALISAMHCATTPQQQLDLAQVLLMVGRPDDARHWLMRAREWRFPESLKPVDTSVLRDRLDVERLLGMPELALADAQTLQQRQSKPGRAWQQGDTDWANDIAYYLADFPDYLPQAEAQARRSIRVSGPNAFNQGTLGWILSLRGDTDEALRLLQLSYRDLSRNEELVADYGLALWRHGRPEQAARLWDEAQAQCVWGRRLHDAMLEVQYAHPYFQPVESDAVKAYRQRCDAPRTKRKRWQAAAAL